MLAKEGHVAYLLLAAEFALPDSENVDLYLVVAHACKPTLMNIVSEYSLRAEIGH